MTHIGLSLECDENGITDLHLDENNSLAIVTEAEAVGQHVKQRIKTFEGEWFLDNQVGVPWIQQLLGRTNNETLVESVIKTVVTDTGGVTGITEFSVSFDRTLRHVIGDDITVSTIYEE